MYEMFGRFGFVGIAPTRERIPTPYKREAGRFAGISPGDATRLIVGDTVVVDACYILCGTTSTSLGNPILAQSRPVSSKTDT